MLKEKFTNSEIELYQLISRGISVYVPYEKAIDFINYLVSKGNTILGYEIIFISEQSIIAPISLVRDISQNSFDQSPVQENFDWLVKELSEYSHIKEELNLYWDNLKVTVDVVFS